jgi:hypothetical protein
MHPAQGQDASPAPPMLQIVCWTPPPMLLDEQQAQTPAVAWLGGVQTGSSEPHCATGPVVAVASHEAIKPTFCAQ